jgi:hypothetical protein
LLTYPPQEVAEIARGKGKENESAYKTWLASKTPDEIRLANKARAALRVKIAKAYPKRKATGFSTLKDDRQVKRPLGAYLLFHNERLASEGGSDLDLGTFAKASGKAWAELNEAEKKVSQSIYILLFLHDLRR